MEVIKIYETEPTDDDADFHHAEDIAFGILKLRGGHHCAERRPVSFHYGAQLLHAVYRDLYPGYGGQVLKVNGRHWMCDDFYEYVHNETGAPVLYLHYAHGDCPLTFFRVVIS
jgi:hypothetical protein